MKKILILEIVALAILIAFSACSKGPNNGDPSSEIKPSSEVTITTNNQTLSSEGGSATIAFKTTGSWIATANVDWLTIDQTAGGGGNNTINITGKKNEEYDQREGLVVISSGEISKSVTVTQKQKDALLLTSNTIILDEQGGTPSIEVKANIEYSCKVEDAAKTWISILSTRALTTSNITLSISENTGSSDRQGNVVIYSGDKSEIVTVYQKAKASGSTTSLAGTSWYYTYLNNSSGGSYSKTTIFSFRTDGTYIYSYSQDSSPTEYSYGTYETHGNSFILRLQGWIGSSGDRKVYDPIYQYTAEIIDNVLYIYEKKKGEDVLAWRLFKL